MHIMEIKKIPVAEPDLTGNEIKYVKDAILNEKRISSSGHYIDKFEANFAKYCNRKYALSVSNGTTALHLALLGLGIGPGDEVIVPTFTFVSSAAVICHVGATPVFIDSKIEDWTMDEKQLDSLKTPHTKALIAVDIYGSPCNYDFIEEWCKKNNIFLIEDAAEAHGSLYKNRIAGSFGIVSCFSFFGNKIITTGEGGMCLTDDLEIFEKMRVLKNHGMKRSGVYENEIIGYNYRFTNVQAAIGCAQFERIDDFIETRKNHDNLYRKLLSSVKEVSFQPISADVSPSFWFFNILISKDVDLVRSMLLKKGIETRPLFNPLNSQIAYKEFSMGRNFPVSEMLKKNGLTLPSGTLLSSFDIEYVVSELRNIFITI